MKWVRIPPPTEVPPDYPQVFIIFAVMFTEYATSLCACCALGDKRLVKRLNGMVADLGEQIGRSIPQALHQRSKIKASYRFFSQ
jgi:Transposase DNA-binding